MNSINNSKTPIKGKEGPAVFFGEPCILPTKETGRRALTYIQYCRQIIRVSRGPFVCTGAPSEFTAAGYMTNPGGAIPRRPEIPFHIRIVGKHFSGIVKGKIKWISKPGAY